MVIFDSILHRQRLQTIRQATRLAGKNPAKLRETVKDYLETKPKARRMEVGARQCGDAPRACRGGDAYGIACRR